jgi:hypothetical protein
MALEEVLNPPAIVVLRGEKQQLIDWQKKNVGSLLALGICGGAADQVGSCRRHWTNPSAPASTPGSARALNALSR